MAERPASPAASQRSMSQRPPSTVGSHSTRSTVRREAERQASAEKMRLTRRRTELKLETIKAKKKVRLAQLDLEASLEATDAQQQEIDEEEKHIQETLEIAAAEEADEYQDEVNLYRTLDWADSQQGLLGVETDDALSAVNEHTGVALPEQQSVPEGRPNRVEFSEYQVHGTSQGRGHDTTSTQEGRWLHPEQETGPASGTVITAGIGILPIVQAGSHAIQHELQAPPAMRGPQASSHLHELQATPQQRGPQASSQRNELQASLHQRGPQASLHQYGTPAPAQQHGPRAPVQQHELQAAQHQRGPQAAVHHDELLASQQQRGPRASSPRLPASSHRPELHAESQHRQLDQWPHQAAFGAPYSSPFVSEDRLCQALVWTSAMTSGIIVDASVATVPLPTGTRPTPVLARGKASKPVLRHGVATSTAIPNTCPEGPQRANTTVQLIELRKKMRYNGVKEVDAYIVPSLDEHQNEYTADRDKRLQYISGFTGTLGFGVVLAKGGSALWTDGRFAVSAREQVPCDWSVMQLDDSGDPDIIDWILKNVQVDGEWRVHVGVDTRLIPHELWQTWERALSAREAQLTPLPQNLVDLVWDVDGRPKPSPVLVYPLKLENTGRTRVEKVADVRNEMRMLGADAMVVTALDEIAWLLNVRAKDVPYSPVFKSYVVLTDNETSLYIQPGKISVHARQSLQVDCISLNCTRVYEYDMIWNDLRRKSEAWIAVLLPSAYAYYPGVSQAVYTMIPEQKRLLRPSPIINIKAQKNAAEIAGMRRAQIRDSAAMCQIFEYVEHHIRMGEVWDERRVAREVDQMRNGSDHSQGLAFETHVGYAAHGALPHYAPNIHTSRPIGNGSTLVIDSGGQYIDGTTDMTRTFHYGQPTSEQINAYTLVLMASIELSRMVFPCRARAADVDMAARAVLWQARQHYQHSTGHGVGAFLHVHESPIQIVYTQRQKIYFKPGYFFSNEPGLYKLGRFGVRLENVLEVIDAPKLEGVEEQNGPYLAFRDVTLVPYEPKLINKAMLTKHHRSWLNNYNKRIRSEIGSLLKQQMQLDAYNWVMNKTAPIEEEWPIHMVPCGSTDGAPSHVTPGMIFGAAMAMLLTHLI